jgi:hypothetical protein
VEEKIKELDKFVEEYVQKEKEKKKRNNNLLKKISTILMESYGSERGMNNSVSETEKSNRTIRAYHSRRIYVSSGKGKESSGRIE